jgi:hypothetical protein
MTQEKPKETRSRPINTTAWHRVGKTGNGAVRGSHGVLGVMIDKQSTEIKHGARR